MSEYLTILKLILPVFATLAVGSFMRWRDWMNPVVEKGVVLMVVKVLYPCLILRAMLQADSFRGSSGAVWAPIVGFGTVVLGFVVSRWLGKLVGIKKGNGLRTFAFATGIYNYGYLPIPLMQDLFGANELAVLFIHNVGIETAIWTVGVSFLAGGSWQDGIKKIFNPMVFALLLGLALNISGWGSELPSPVTSSISMLAGCAIPLGLMAIGSNLFDHIKEGEKLWGARESLLSVFLRLGLLPIAGLLIAVFFPLDIELKRVLVFQAAMPAGIMPIVLAKHYGGQPIVAVRVVFATTAIGFVTMPLWIHFGLQLIGGET
ncbi:AEC family transporter [Pelagicoccus albus]|uniref:AEC family transporter n=1 Tax=Pelagicoccus albus TaxID=415222 RepID=A0A7X1E7P3_9BACT|nr:AEC family transporter [Pelagicoccus albus]MBC2605406.1 AEC family transporter [Pelagicoccus albus]